MIKRITDKLEQWMNGPNERNIIKYILSNEEVSRTDISKALLVSMSTVTNVTDKLLKKNLIRESGIQKTNRGRSTILIQVSKEKFKSIGIGINSKFVSVSLIDLSGHKYYHSELPLEKSSWIKNYENISKEIKQLLKENSNYADDILGIGVEPPVFIEYRMENLDFKFDFDDQWDIDKLIEILEEKYEYGVTYHSSFSCLLSGESFFGNAKHYKNVINVNVSSVGLGWAKMDNNIIDRNISKSFRNIGHMVININGPQCKCLQHGCLELYTGKDALVNNYIKLASLEDEFNTSNGNIDDLNYHNILEYAEKGDYIAVQSISKAATILGIALGNVASMMHPDMIILYGGIIRESNLYFDITKKTINDKLKTILEKEIVIERPTVLQHKIATSIGSATLVFEQIFLDA